MPVIERTSAANAAPHKGKEYLAVLRGDVIDAAGHWLGNLFQRLRSIEQSLAYDGNPIAAPLKMTVDDLERLTRLLFDYVGEPLGRLQTLPVPDLVANVVVTLEREFRLQVHNKDSLSAEDELLVDPFAVTSAVNCLAALLREDGVAAGSVLAIDVEATKGLVRIGIGADRSGAQRSAAGELYHGVIEKNLVAQGGEFWSHQGSRGQREWVLVLPLRRSVDAAERT